MECCSSRKGRSSSPAFPFIPPAPLYHGTWAVCRAGLCGAVFSAQQPSKANSHGSQECTPGAALRAGQKPQLAAGCWCGCLGAGSRIYKTSRARLWPWRLVSELECRSLLKGGSLQSTPPFTMEECYRYHGTWAVRRARLCGAVISAQKLSAAKCHGSKECTPGAALWAGQKPQLAAGCRCGCLGAGSRIYKTSTARLWPGRLVSELECHSP